VVRVHTITWKYCGSFFAATRKVYDFIMRAAADGSAPPPGGPDDEHLFQVYAALGASLANETDTDRISGILGLQAWLERDTSASLSEFATFLGTGPMSAAHMVVEALKVWSMHALLKVTNLTAHFSMPSAKLRMRLYADSRLPRHVVSALCVLRLSL